MQAVPIFFQEEEERIPTRLRVLNDCYWPNGAELTIGNTRAVTYQLLDQHDRPFYGHPVYTVRETIEILSGPDITSRGVWSPGNGMNPNHTFTDFLSSNGWPTTVEAQLFSAGRGALGVTIGHSSGSLLINELSPSGVTMNGVGSPRECSHERRDPW